MQFSQTAADVISVLDEIWKEVSKPIGLHEPKFTQDETDYVASVIAGGWVSTAGPEIEQFEQALARASKVDGCVAVNSGTAALHLAMKVLGLGPGDGVALPSLGFVATANAITYVGAEPHFIDVDPVHGLLDVELLNAYLDTDLGRQIRAIVTVNLYGQKDDPTALLDLAAARNLYVIEDAAGAFGSKFNENPIGSDFDATTFSFNGNKILTTGGGGAVLFKKEEHLKQARYLASVAKVNSGVFPSHSDVGFNYKMPNINAALGLSQISKLPTYIARKHQLRAQYRDLVSAKTFDLVEDPNGCQSNAWLSNILLSELSDTADEIDRLTEILQACQQNGYGVRPSWEPLHLTPMYKNQPRSKMDVSESLARRLVSLPSSPPR